MSCILHSEEVLTLKKKNNWVCFKFEKAARTAISRSRPPKDVEEDVGVTIASSRRPRDDEDVNDNVDDCDETDDDADDDKADEKVLRIFYFNSHVF